MTSAAPTLADAFGVTKPPTDDVAFQPPRDPLDADKLKATASTVHREIPLVTVATSWGVADVRAAYGDLVIGLFDRPAQLVDSVTGDSRVLAGMSSRVGGLLGRPVEFQVPRRYRDSDTAKECSRAFEDAWPTMAAEPILSELQKWGVMLGFGPAQVLWDTGGRYAIPHPRPWHPRYCYYHWIYRCYVAITQDGQVPITPGDGHWILHAPHGQYRGWMNGAVRAIAPWWLARNYALRDWARYSERHGMPIIKAETPAAADPAMVAQFRSAVAQLGQETAIQLPKGVDGVNSYDVKLLEASDTAWEGFAQLIAACDREITLALLAQNLTTEVKEGSFAAARVHADVRQALVEADARALADTIYMQLARPFAAMNFGDPDLAPRVRWDVTPFEDSKTKTETLMLFAQAIYALRNSGLEVEDVGRLAREFGVNLGDVKKVDPLQMATAGVKAQEGAAKAKARTAPSRFEAIAAESLRLRIEAGATEEDVQRENEAIADLLADAKRAQAKVKKQKRA